MTSRILPLSIVFLALVGPARAASVSFSIYTATGPTDTSWVITTAGAGSASLGGADTSFGGVSWEGSLTNGHPNNETYVNHSGFTISHRSPTSWAANIVGLYPADSTLTLLNTGTTAGSNGTIDLSGLVIGQDYLAKFVFARGFAAGDTVAISLGAGNTGSLPSTQFGYTDGKYLVVTASWTADSTQISFIPTRGGFQTSTVSAVQLTAIPEPSALALLGVMSAAGILRRKRRKM